MKCLSCLYNDTKVIDSRVISEGLIIRRRRECPKCGFRFSTKEETEILDLIVVKKDNARESYSRPKLEDGLHKALEKCEISEDVFSKMVTRIERDIQVKYRSEISSEKIGEIVLKHLKKIDKVAYLRFASVYNSFQDLEDFDEALSLIKKTRTQKNKKTSLPRERTRNEDEPRGKQTNK